MKNIKTIIFDLDDTLYDHRYSQRRGLEQIALEFNFSFLSNLNKAANIMQQVLEIVHQKYLDGKINRKQKSDELFDLFFKKNGINTTPKKIEQIKKVYELAYSKSKRSVPGVSETLSKLKQAGYQVAILSNGSQKGQEQKIKIIKINKYIDILLTSEKLGLQKPNPKIFFKTLELIDKKADEVVMVGDNLINDINGSIDTKIKPIYYNPESKSNFTIVGEYKVRTISAIKELLEVFDIK